MTERRAGRRGRVGEECRLRGEQAKLGLKVLAEFG